MIDKCYTYFYITYMYTRINSEYTSLIFNTRGSCVGCKGREVRAGRQVSGLSLKTHWTSVSFQRHHVSSLNFSFLTVK